MRKLVLALAILANLELHAVEDVSNDHCGLNKESQQLALMIIKDENQQRNKLVCNRLLAQAAAEKARLMKERGMVAHNLGGSPNNWLSDRGYELPDYYGAAFSNQVEAVAGGYTTAAAVWRGFKNSKAHREHLLGELPFYQEQDEIGVGFVQDYKSPHDEYWVVYVAKGAVAGQRNPFAGEKLPNKGDIIMVNMESTSAELEK